MSETIIGCAMKVHSCLGPGFLESVYANALAIELANRGMKYTREHRISVYYADVVVGEFACDLLVEEKLLRELKAIQSPGKADAVQTQVSDLLSSNREFSFMNNHYQKLNPVNLVNPV